jgi:hypothetical protein
MENLTQYLRIVGTEQAGIHVQVGHYTVLLKQVDEGRVFHSVLQPGQRPPDPGFFGKFFKDGHAFVSIPVSATSHLRHSFTSAVKHVSPGHAFEVHYVIGFVVSSPEKIATRWVADPVREIEAEVKRFIDPLFRNTNWETLQRNILDDGGVHLFQAQTRQTIELQLKPYAEDRGIDLQWISGTLELSREDEKTKAERAAAARHLEMVQISTCNTIATLDGEHAVKKHQTQQGSELSSLTRPEAVRDAGVEALRTAIIEIGNNIHKPEELENAIRKILATMGNSANGAALPGGISPLALNEAPSGPEQVLVKDIAEIAGIIATLSGDAKRRRELLATLLHLFADAYEGETPDPDPQHLKQATDLLALDWGGSLGAPQYKTLNRIRDFEALRERFK